MPLTTLEAQSIQTSFIPEAAENGSDSYAVKPHLWTQDEYYKMAELGFFHGKRVELIEGEIVEMSPMKSPHATALTLLYQVLSEFFRDGFVVRSQIPISFSKISEPEPDIAVVKGKTRDFVKSHPKTAELIIEVSDTTLSYDRNQKASLYAKNKIKDYWILNLKDRRLEVYRRPIKDDTMLYNFGYAERLILTAEDKVSPLVKPDVKIAVADLLP